MVELFEVRNRDAHDSREHAQWKRERELRHEVGAALTHKLIDQFVGDRLDLLFHLATQRAQGEGRRDDSTMAKMLSTFHLEDGAPDHEADATRVPLGRERLGILQTRDHVVIPRDHVARVHPILHRDDGPLGAQTAVDAVRIRHRAHYRATEELSAALVLYFLNLSHRGPLGTVELDHSIDSINRLI